MKLYNVVFTKSKLIPALDWDWFEQSCKQKSISGMTEDKEVARLTFEDGFHGILRFIRPMNFETFNTPGYFAYRLLDNKGEFVSEWGVYKSLTRFENFMVVLTDYNEKAQTQTERRYVAIFLREPEEKPL